MNNKNLKEQCTLAGYTLCANYIDEQGKEHPRYFELKINSERSLVFMKSQTNVSYQSNGSTCQTDIKGIQECDTICFSGPLFGPAPKFRRKQENKVFEIAVDDLPTGTDYDSIHNVINQCCPTASNEQSEVQPTES